MDNKMSVSEYYEYKKDNDKEIADYKAEQEKAKDQQKKEEEEQTKEKIKDVITSIPHFTKLSGAAAIAGLIGAGVNKAKELFK